MPDVRILTRTTVSASTTTATLRRARAGHRPSARAAASTSRASGSGASSPSARWCATGAFERPIVFPGNDRPASCWRRRCAPTSTAMRRAPGERLALFTNNDDGWQTVDAALRAPGCRVAGVVDARADVSAEQRALAAQARLRRAQRRGRPTSTAARSGIGADRGRAAPAARGRTLEADALAVSGGWYPSVGLTSQPAAARPTWRRRHRRLRAGRTRRRAWSAPALPMARSRLPTACAKGTRRARRPRADLGFGGSAGEAPASDDDAAVALAPLWHVAGKQARPSSTSRTT